MNCRRSSSIIHDAHDSRRPAGPLSLSWSWLPACHKYSMASRPSLGWVPSAIALPHDSLLLYSLGYSTGIARSRDKGEQHHDLSLPCFCTLASSSNLSPLFGFHSCCSGHRYKFELSRMATAGTATSRRQKLSITPTTDHSKSTDPSLRTPACKNKSPKYTHSSCQCWDKGWHDKDIALSRPHMLYSHSGLVFFRKKFDLTGNFLDFGVN